MLDSKSPMQTIDFLDYRFLNRCPCAGTGPVSPLTAPNPRLSDSNRRRWVPATTTLHLSFRAQRGNPI